ncbi:MAG: hypothetical protein ABFD08_00230 [Syntrophomonas sp.]
MRNQKDPEIDDYIADYLSSWPDVEGDPAIQQRAAKQVARELRKSRRLSAGGDEEEFGIKIIFALVGMVVTGSFLLGIAAPFAWYMTSSCLALLLPVPTKYVVLYACFAVVLSLIVLVLKMHKLEVVKYE